MKYVLPYGAIQKLKTLREQYQKREGIDLKQPLGFFGMPTALGGTNVAARAKQIAFLEKILAMVSPHIKDGHEINSEEKYDNYYRASKVVLSACLFIQAQISPTYKARSAQNSDLYYLINENLGMRSINKMDKEDKRECSRTALVELNMPNAFEQINHMLKKLNIEPFSIAEWDDFYAFVSKESHIDKSKSDFSNWPCTTVSRPLFGYIGGTIGATAGVLTGGMLSASSYLKPGENYMAATVGNGILLFGIGSTLGAPFVAPVIASKLLDIFLKIFLAKSLHYAFQIAGESFGMAIGVPLDLAYQLLCKACSSVYALTRDEDLGLSGLRIGDGKQLVNGIALDVVHPARESELSSEQKDNAVIIQQDGSFIVNGKTFHTQQFMPSVIEELKSTLPLESEAIDEKTALLEGATI